MLSFSSFMFVYLDNWTLIPLSLIWITNLIIFGGQLEESKVLTFQHSNILLNSIISIFFPSFHVHLPDHTSQSTLSDMRLLQRKSLRAQAFITNSIYLIILIIILYLVTFNTTFNYNPNLLNSYWFNILVIIIFISGIISIIIAANIEINNYKINLRNLIKTFLLIILIFVPLVTTVGIYKCYNAEDEAFIYAMEHDQGNVKVSIISSRLTNVASKDSHLVISGTLNKKCELSQDEPDEEILLVNTTILRCRLLLQDKKFYELVSRSRFKATIILDSSFRSQFRTSSPLKHVNLNDSVREVFKRMFNQVLQTDNHPLLHVNVKDWIKFQVFFKEDATVHISSEISRKILDNSIRKTFSCSNSNSIMISEDDEQCRPGKYLHTDHDHVVETLCVARDCSRLGSECQIVEQSSWSVEVPCSVSSPESPVFISSSGHTIARQQLSSDILLRFRHELYVSTYVYQLFFSEIDYCCLNSTYLELYGAGCFSSWSQVSSYSGTCHWTLWSQHTCSLEMMTVSRLCRVPGSRCVIREFYMKICSKNIILPMCSDSNNQCSRNIKN